MKSFLAKSILVLSVLFMLVGFMPVGQSNVSANSFDQQESLNFDQSALTEDNYSNEGENLTQFNEDQIILFAEPGPTYPGTNVEMRIGDILYSTKTLGSSSQIVGHTGIVNSNFKVVHVTLPVNGGTVDNMTGYMNRHGVGETIKVYRPRDGRGVNAAKWATYNYSSVKEYSIEPFAKLGTLSPNYCSKFIWQAFYFGEGLDMLNLNNTPDLRGFVTPSMIASSPNVIYLTSFTAR
ncbi:hypothetical protein [Paenibacillus glacialis]|uniref:Uncharacterized protein n=1 Tax=Paenibacillus glacialis TaxID=494026 RepID=A0A168DDS3_9BACL|nr:hypothetical protein [Paenibacillus glacialis]OAB34106.1 hypothetical protein PGLA_24730 [Paenibacillus glacialis]